MPSDTGTYQHCMFCGLRVESGDEPIHRGEQPSNSLTRRCSKLDEFSDHIDRLKLEHDETRGYRQHAEQMLVDVKTQLKFVTHELNKQREMFAANLDDYAKMLREHRTVAVYDIIDCLTEEARQWREEP